MKKEAQEKVITENLRVLVRETAKAIVSEMISPRGMVNEATCAAPMTAQAGNLAGQGAIRPSVAKGATASQLHERIGKAWSGQDEKRREWVDAVVNLRAADPLMPGYEELAQAALRAAHDFINSTDYYRGIIGGIYT